VDNAQAPLAWAESQGQPAHRSSSDEKIMAKKQTYLEKIQADIEENEKQIAERLAELAV
jgi:hypothetical protein